MSTHNGTVLCLNCLSFASNPDKTREEEHVAIIAGINTGKEMGAQPGAVLLQDYPWATAVGLDVLISQINAATGDSWAAVRQWGGEQDENTECLRDAVVIYDTAIYSGVDLNKDDVGSFRDIEDLLAGMQTDIKVQLAGFVGRWAGVELTVAGTKDTFLLVSYHGRGVIHANNDVLPVQTVVKAAMSKDFIAQVADLGAKDAAPALVAGCFNTDSYPLTANGGVKSDSRSKTPWASSVHLPHEVQTDAVGQPVNWTDYVVAVENQAVSCSTNLKVVDVLALRHPAHLASHFKHRPLLIKIEVGPRA